MQLPYFNCYSNIAFQMKKSDFENRLDLKVVEDTRAPIEKFDNINDFYTYCNGLTDGITNKKYGGRREETKIQRQSMLQEWFDYILRENDAYTPSIAYMILNGITRDLKPNDETLPPVLNKGILAQTVEDAQNKVDKENNLKFNFEKMYKLNLQKNYLSTDKEKTLDKNINGWIIIPSQKQDNDNFDKNVEKLKMLSHNNWCTKSYNARHYLKKGEFHVYMEKGRPRLGVRFVGDEIQEIQGPKNNSKIPIKYSDIAMEHIRKYNLSDKALEEVNQLYKSKRIIEKYKKENFPNGIENATTQEILEAAEIECKKDKDGMLVISHYKPLVNDNLIAQFCGWVFTFEDLGVNENKLFKSIKEIKRDADFNCSQVTSLGNLKSIGGNANFKNSKIISLGNLQTIGENANFENSQVKSLGNLQSIGMNANFKNSKKILLGNLQTIGGDADFTCSQVTDLCNLQSIKGNVKFSSSQVKSLGDLQTIGGDAYFFNSQITSLGNLKSIGGKANFEYAKCTSLGNLQSIGGDAYFRHSKITNLGNLQSIGGDAYFMDSQVTSLGKLKLIGGNACIENSKLKPSDFDNIIVKRKIVV